MSDVLVPIQVLIKLSAIMNGMLSYWVEGNALTDPRGETLVSGMVAIIERLTEFYSQILSLF